MVPSLRGLRSGGVPAPIPVLGPSEGSNTTSDDPQTMRTPIPTIPSSFFVGVPDARGGESHPESAVDANAVAKHIESHSLDLQLHFPTKPFRSHRPPPPPPVTPSRPPAPEQSYHTVSIPCTREANSTEIATILQAPSRLLGRKFTPSHGQEIWEAVEVSVGTTGTNPDGTPADDGHRPAIPSRLQNPEMMEGTIQAHSKVAHWTKEPDVMDAFVDRDDEENKPVPQLVGTREVVVKFRGYEGQVGEHYMLVRNFVEMLKDRTVLIVELE